MAAIILGLLLAVFTQFFAYTLAWGGEGWNAPFEVSLTLFIIYPIVLVRVARRSGASIKGELALLLLAAALDSFIVWESLTQEGGFLVNVWLALWLLWQVLTVISLIRRLDPEEEEGLTFRA